MQRRTGFTLIELLVVIAIIGILAAMLFPVFARARESARKTQCLANVKNIAIAVQMYLVDYDKLWPSEHRQEVISGFQEMWDQYSDNTCATDAPSKMNPYLKPPVILEDYIKNRDVWTCPSAHASGSYSILNSYGADWWGVITMLGGQGSKDAGFGQCSGGAYPPGWGGDLTDSVKQNNADATGPGAFMNSINVTILRNISTSQMADPARFVVVGETPLGMPFANPSEIAYPDAFAMCGTGPSAVACCGGNWVDWDNCPWSQDCGADHHLDYADPEVRKQHGRPRHLGGANVGFADGHAKWFNSEDILNNYAPDNPVRKWIFDDYGTQAAWQARQDRATWSGFMDGICMFWGTFGIGNYSG